MKPLESRNEEKEVKPRIVPQGIRLVPGTREKENSKESSIRTEIGYSCPFLRRERCIGRNQSKEFGNLVAYLR